MASTAQIKFILQPEWVLRSFPKGWALEQGWHGEVLYPWEPSRGEEAESRKIGGDKRHQRRDGHLLQGLALQGDQGLQGSPRGPEERGKLSAAWHTLLGSPGPRLQDKGQS